MLYHQSVGTHRRNREECTVNTEGNRKERGREEGREGGRDGGWQGRRERQ